MGGLFHATRAAEAASGSQLTLGGNDSAPETRTTYEEPPPSPVGTASSETSASAPAKTPYVEDQSSPPNHEGLSEKAVLPGPFDKAWEMYKAQQAAPSKAQSSARDDGGLPPRDYQNFENVPSQEPSGRKTGLPPLFDKTWEIYEEGKPTVAVQPSAAPSPPATKTGPAQSSGPTKPAPAQPAAPATASIPIPAANAPLRSDAEMSAVVDQRFKNTPIAGQWLKIKSFAQKHNVNPVFMLAIIAHETGFGSAGLRYNNPGGLMDWKNKSLTKLKFNTLDDGFDYMAKTIARNSARPNVKTIADFANKYAPPGGVPNDPKNTNQHWPVRVPQYLREFSGP